GRVHAVAPRACERVGHMSSAERIAPAAPNPLLAEWTGPYGGVPPFDVVSPELFPGAFEAAIAERRAELEGVAANAVPATFENTLLAVLLCGRALHRVQTLFGVMTQSVCTPLYRELDGEWAPPLAAARDEIVFDSRQFARIETVYR